MKQDKRILQNTTSKKLQSNLETKSAELEKAKLDLKTEAALERVRTVALAMNQPADMLKVCRVISKELENLGIKEIRNVQTAVIDEGRGSYLNYEYFRLHKSTSVTEIEFRKHKYVAAFAKKMIQYPDGYFTKTYKGAELKEWIKYQTNSGQFVDPQLKKIKSLHYYFYSIGAGALGISAYAPLNKDEISLFKRFRNAFLLAYRRFIDIQKAEAHAREAKVEAALERVRSRSMGMHRSDELAEVVDVLYKQFEELDFDLYQVLISIYDRKNNVIEWWSRGFGDIELPQRNIIPVIDHPFSNDLFDKWEKGIEYYPHILEGEMKRSWEEYLFTRTDLKNFPKNVKKAMKSLDKVHLSDVFMKYGSLQAAGPIPLPDDKVDILKRFVKVVDLAYTRMIDLQKAETQAREAKIEAALEKVRAKVMSMVNSKDLADTSLVFGEQLRKLGIDWQFSYFWLIEEEKDENKFWITWPDNETSTTTYSLEEADESFRDCIVAWKRKDKIHFSYIPPEGVVGWLNTFERITADAGGEAVEIMQPDNFKEGVYYYDAMIKFGSFGILINRPINDEEKNIQIRFATEFERAYTRFLDLQKAEAQTRESLIELGLERVRARAMAMHSSEELKDLIKTVSSELVKLDLVLDRCFIMIYDSKSMGTTWWMSGPEKDEDLIGLFVKYHEHPPYLAYINAWKERRVKWQYVLEGDVKKEWDRYIFSETDFAKLPEQVVSNMKMVNKVYLSGSFNNFGCLSIATPELLTDEQFDILLRFAKVFDLTYTRFNDLKLAEAQAKESRIQLALERVRARTMAMQKSNEIAEAAQLLYEEFRKLQINTFLCGYIFYKEEQNKQTAWVTTPDGTLIPDFTDFPLTGDHVLDKRYEDWKRKKALHVMEIHGEANKEHHRFLASQVPDQIANEIFAQIPDRVIFYCANFSAGYLFIIATEFLTTEEEKTIIRFAKVFELTYTRFLDLQNAEAQAREAKIESALERVRSRTMAMQRSEELDSVIKTVYAELKQLDVSFDRCFIMIFDEQKGAIWWMGSPEHDLFHKGFYVQYHNHPPHLAYLKGWEERQQKWEYSLGGQIKKDWDEFIFSKTELSKLPPPAIHYMRSFEHAYLTASFESFGCMTTGGQERLNEESFNILNRFAKVFDQTYRRFLDLQNAEAQAREAQIETALERVRTRTMAMQKSGELSDVAELLFKEVKNLGINTWTTGFNVWSDDNNSFTDYITNPQGGFIEPYIVVATEYPIFIKMSEAKKSGEEFFVHYEEGELLAETYRQLAKYGENQFKTILQSGFQFPSKQYEHIVFGAKVSLMFITYEPVPEAHNIFKRFGKVFEQTYTRFLDLQKAEAQAKESLIELGLERVRARAMAMHSSGELSEVVNVLFQQMQSLGFDLYLCNIVLIDKDTLEAEYWVSGSEETVLPQGYHIPYFEHPVYQYQLNIWKNAKSYDVFELSDDMKREWDEILMTQTEIRKLPEALKVKMKEADKVVLSSVSTKNGVFQVIGLHVLADEYVPVLKRFANVFDQTYTRFLDLQKAEAQAKEAKIEASLERVRAKAMAMHSSKDLAETISAFYHELGSFGIIPRRCGVGLLDRETHIAELSTINTTDTGSSIEIIGQLKMVGHPVLEAIYDNWVLQKEYYPVLRGNEIKAYYQFIKPQIQFPDYPDDMVQFGYFFYFPEGAMYAWTDKEIGEEEFKIFRRFTSVLSLTYKRYKDLKEAEAQARESQIELGLERLRARAMAMQSSDELKELIAVLSMELGKLDFVLDRCFINIIDTASMGMTWWMSNPETSQSIGLGVKYHEYKPYLEHLKAWKERRLKFQYILEGQEKKEWDKFLFTETELSKLPEVTSANMRTNEKVYLSSSFNNFGYLSIATLEPLTDEQFDILLRFAKVFDLTYTRFNDLKLAEARARESKIEASLERVRAKAMAMHSSEDLTSTIGTFYHELKSLGVTPRRCGVALMDKETRIAEISSMNTTEEGESVQVLGTLKMAGHPILDGIFEHWLLQKEFHAMLRGPQIKEYYQVVRPQIEFPDYPHDVVQYGYYFMFPEGDVVSWNENELSEQELQIYRRFTSVLSLTYKRYKDLKQAEAQAREAKVEVALERVRAKALAMQTSTELFEVAKSLREQMGILGQWELEASVVHLYHENAEEFDSWYAFRPAGASSSEIITGTARFNVNDCELTREFLSMFRSEPTEYTLKPEGKKLREFLELLSAKSPDIKKRWGNDVPETAYYHFSDFTGGTLLMVSDQAPSPEAMNLQRRAASVFDLAYRRHLDLKQKEEQDLRLKLEKERLEHTLGELQATQKQLIQAEKMASLGELTAGIAHEIQNPLNFINNFSEVNSELISEMKEEIEIGNLEEAKVIANDIQENEEKISHHGKRADAIVKSMLQHTRGSGNKKEATNINALADEYLRLAFHGLRAKDKSFNAKFETDFDPTIELINVVPQDMGRVILNLINNAFYAVSEKNASVNSSGQQYMPTVSVGTKRNGDKIFIYVKDNGNGIPPKVVDKIFQPFFTTKPTGQGTGLGLSLAYDIVTKSHGGTINVVTNEGHGTEFIIELPGNS